MSNISVGRRFVALFVAVGLFASIASLAVVPLAADAAIRIAPALTILTPNGGEKLHVGDQYTISWDFPEYTRNVSIYLVNGSGQGAWIVTNAKIQGEYTWDVSKLGLKGKNFKIQVVARDRTNARVTDISDRNFKIVN